MREDYGPLTAVEAIIAIDPDSAEAQALLMLLAARLRNSPESSRRQQAAFLIAQYGPSARAAAASLREALKSEVADVRQWSLFVLYRIGVAAKPAIGDLSALARDDPDPNVRRSAQAALKRVDRE